MIDASDFLPSSALAHISFPFAVPFRAISDVGNVVGSIDSRRTTQVGPVPVLVPL